MKIINELNYYRTKRKLSLRGLSKLSGVSKTEIWSIENNRTEPGITNCYKLADALGVSIEELFVRGDESDKKSKW